MEVTDSEHTSFWSFHFRSSANNLSQQKWVIGHSQNYIPYVVSKQTSNLNSVSNLIPDNHDSRMM